MELMAIQSQLYDQPKDTEIKEDKLFELILVNILFEVGLGVSEVPGDLDVCFEIVIKFIIILKETR